MNNITYLYSTPSGRVYYFNDLHELTKFKIFWQLDFIVELEPKIK